jgi:hypothetical protein
VAACTENNWQRFDYRAIRQFDPNHDVSRPAMDD